MKNPKGEEHQNTIRVCRRNVFVTKNSNLILYWKDTPLGKVEPTSHFDELVREQRRDVMDMLLPLQLTREIAANCHKKRFWYDPTRQALRVADEGFLIPGKYIEMTALEVHDRFGGSMIEEVCEYGSVQVNDGN